MGTSAAHWEQLLIFGENYAEQHPSSGYLYKNLEKVWLSSLVSAGCHSHTLYITCSDDYMWNGIDNLLPLYPYKDAHAATSADNELQELWPYLQDFLQRSSQGTVAEYLQHAKFSSTLSKKWSRVEAESVELRGRFRRQLQNVRQNKRSLDLLASLKN